MPFCLNKWCLQHLTISASNDDTDVFVLMAYHHMMKGLSYKVLMEGLVQTELLLK